jgi:hypothetical protein
MQKIRDCIERIGALRIANPGLQSQTSFTPPENTIPESITDIRSENARLQEVHSRLQGELMRTTTIIEVRNRLQSTVAAVERARAAQKEDVKKSTKEELQSIADRASLALEGLHSEIGLDRHSEIKASLQACLEAQDVPAASLLLSDLRVRIRRANQEAEARQKRLNEQRDQEARAATDFLLRLDSLGREVDIQLRDDLIEVSSGQAQFTEALRSKTETAIATAEHGFAGDVLKETLEQLGYDVRQGFETLFAEGGSGFFQRPSWGEHHVRVTVDANRQRLNLDMVRYGDAGEPATDQKLRDKEMEEQWCSEVPGLVGKLSNQGLAIDLTRKLAPGTIALQVIHDERIKPGITRRQTKRNVKRESSL